MVGYIEEHPAWRVSSCYGWTVVLYWVLDGTWTTKSERAVGRAVVGPGILSVWTPAAHVPVKESCAPVRRSYVPLFCKNILEASQI